MAYGELDLATVPALDAVMRRAERDADRVVLDLTAVDFLDSSGAHLLVDADRRIRAAGGELLIAGAGQVVRRTLELLAIDRDLQLVDELTVRVDDHKPLVPTEWVRADKDVSPE